MLEKKKNQRTLTWCYCVQPARDFMNVAKDIDMKSWLKLSTVSKKGE